MLILNRRPGESILIEIDGQQIAIVVKQITRRNRDGVRFALLGIDAPREIPVVRSELIDNANKVD